MVGDEIFEQPVKEVLDRYPRVGEILSKYEIGCIACSIGTCKLKDVVKIHFLPEDVNTKLMKEIKNEVK